MPRKIRLLTLEQLAAKKRKQDARRARGEEYTDWDFEERVDTIREFFGLSRVSGAGESAGPPGGSGRE